MQIGDRVEISGRKYPYLNGRTGIVRGFSTKWSNWAVELDHRLGDRVFDFHDCDGIVSSGIGWFFPQEDLIVVITQENTVRSLFPSEAAERKKVPVFSGVLDYFPAAIAEVAKVSFQGNQQHNPGEELHWARGKSTDQSDTIVRHLMERGTIDTDGMRHSAKAAWRALALLQLELEAEGYPKARGAK